MAANTLLFTSQNRLCYSTGWVPQLIRAQERPRRRRQEASPSSAPLRRHSVIHNRKARTFTYRTCDDVPLHHFPGAAPVWFEEYMEDKGRLVDAVIPEKSTAIRLNPEEWRIRMPVVQALFFKIQPVIDISMATKSNGRDYPPHVPPHVPKLCHTHITKCELEGLSSAYMPPFFNLEASGTLYPVTHRSDGHCVIKNQLETNITFVFPPLLSWVPPHVVEDIVRSIVRTVVEEIKKGYTVRLIADYSSFQRSRLKNWT